MNKINDPTAGLAFDEPEYDAADIFRKVDTAGSPRPWAGLIEGDSPWDEHKAFEDWIKTKIHSETCEYFENAPSGFSSYLYAALADEFDKANDLG